MPRLPPSAISTFSGIGGLDLGLERAGFQVLTCVESDEVARRSLKANRSEWGTFGSGLIEEAAELLTPAELGLRVGELDLLAGAPPCQPYSKAAMWQREAWNGFEDPRAKPILAFLNLLESFLPRAILLENVQGFVSGPKSAHHVLEARLGQINRRHGCNYKIDWQIVDAADFGVAQHRRRAIVVAYRDGYEMKWPKPTHSASPMRAWDAIGGLVEDDDRLRPQGRWADLLPTIPEGQNYLFHTAEGGGLPLFGYRTRYWSFLLKLARDRPSWTLPAQPGPATGPFHWNNRPLSVREMLSLQSFPLDWQVEGSRRDQVRQIGNATPPLLAEVLGRVVYTQLVGHTWTQRPSLELTRAPSVPMAAEVKAVPQKYLHLVSPKPAHPGAGLGPRPRSKPASK